MMENDAALKMVSKYHLKTSEHVVRCKYCHFKFKEKDKVVYRACWRKNLIVM